MRLSIIILGMALCTLQGHAQNKNKASFDDFRREIHEDFQNFRRQCMDEYAEFVRLAWEEFNGQRAEPLPKEKPVPPLVIPKEEQEKPRPIESRPIIINDVIPPIVIDPQPLPIEPIKPVPTVEDKKVDFTFFGTKASVRFDTDCRIALKDASEGSIADGLKALAGEECDNMILDCIKLREDRQLCDWAYLQMLKELSRQIYGKDSNEAVLLMAYIYMMSGYQMRLASSGNRLYMLYASRHYIYGQMMYSLNGWLYYGMEPLPDKLHICEAAFPQEKPLSLLVSTCQGFDNQPGKARVIKSIPSGTRTKELKVEVAVNKNLMDFYNTYPTSMTDGNMMTRWAMYANTPMADDIQRSVYPQLKNQLEGHTQSEALDMLLNWVQTGFEYEYDNTVWGEDRAFFAEESLFYPYCDCEDRSILFTRLVRDLLGLKCLLVYYPGHLASAVAVDNVPGDYIETGGCRYVIADGTYIGAGLGRTMPGMDNKTANVIVLGD